MSFIEEDHRLDKMADGSLWDLMALRAHWVPKMPGITLHAKAKVYAQRVGQSTSTVLTDVRAHDLRSKFPQATPSELRVRAKSSADQLIAIEAVSQAKNRRVYIAGGDNGSPTRKEDKKDVKHILNALREQPSSTHENKEQIAFTLARVLEEQHQKVRIEAARRAASKPKSQRDLERAIDAARVAVRNALVFAERTGVLEGEDLEAQVDSINRIRTGIALVEIAISGGDLSQGAIDWDHELAALAVD